MRTRTPMPRCPKCESRDIYVHSDHDGWYRCGRCNYPWPRSVFIDAVKNGTEDKFKYKG